MKRYLFLWVIIALGVLTLPSCRQEADGSSNGSTTDVAAVRTTAQKASMQSPSSDTNNVVHAAASSDVRPALHGGAGSIDELMSKAMTALEHRDTAMLNDLMITRQEWEKSLYPEFGVYYPAARDPRPEVREFLWSNHSMSSDKALRRSLARNAELRLTLDSVRFEDTVQVFPSYTIHQGTVADAHDRERKAHELRCFGSIVEMNGVYKLLSFRDRN